MSDAQRLRDKAEECRTIADHWKTFGNRQVMYELSEQYEYLARMDETSKKLSGASVMPEATNPKDGPLFWQGVAHGFEMVAEHMAEEEDRAAMLQMAADCRKLAEDLKAGKPFADPIYLRRLNCH